ncbi:cytochrome c biogenesis CcdA family protein [Rossellomorea sp. NS-SX7]|uniref:cytochrome c biogenesis CcdA family protein n=1 Tax=Rossellomorea sp. NS-SX7 TaxID=3463856 RepID=UPI004057EF60
MAEQLVIGGVFAAGLLSFFNPCILPLLPVYIAFLSGSKTSANENTPVIRIGFLRLHPVLIIRTLLFVFGISTVFILLGFGLGVLGRLVTSPTFISICGAVVIMFGIYQTGLIKLPWLARERRFSLRGGKNGGYASAYLLGLTFSFGWTPCIGPILAAILSIAAGEGSPAYGGFLMLIYTLGLAIPFLVMAIFSDILLQRMKKLNKYTGYIKVFSGIILIIMGVLLLTDQLNTIVVWFEKI